jgi:hypothetical protein
MQLQSRERIVIEGGGCQAGDAVEVRYLGEEKRKVEERE